MAWGLGTGLIGSNLGMSPEMIILTVTCLGTLIFFAKDFTLGLILFFLNAVLNFMLGYYMEVNWAPALTLAFMAFIVLAFSLYFVDKSAARGGIV